VLFLQLLSQGSTDVPALLAEVARVWEAVTTAEAACIVAVHAAETCAQEAAMSWDSAVLHVKNAEDRATLA
jgi:hypothetical protein